MTIGGVNVWRLPELAQVAGLTLRRVQLLAERGRFPNAVLLGRDWIVPESDVQRFLTSDRDRRKGPRGRVIPRPNRRKSAAAVTAQSGGEGQGVPADAS